MNESQRWLYQRIATGERFDLAAQTSSHVTLRHEATGEFTMIDIRTLRREYERVVLASVPAFDVEVPDGETVLVGED